MDPIDELFAKKTRQAADIVRSRVQQETKPADVKDIPFEVNKVLHQIGQETQRRAKLLKRKPQ